MSAPDPNHYSYAVYAEKETAESFEETRFGGPIGAILRRTQEEQLARWIAAPAGRKVLDIGAGTGRTAIPLAQAGAEVVAADASVAMLEVADRNARNAGVTISMMQCDVMNLPFAERQFDTVLCFRVLMHVTDWRAGLKEIARVSGDEIIYDFPPRWSLAALQVPVRWLAQLFNPKVQRFRLFSVRQMRRELQRNGYECAAIERLWVLPIALHKALGRPGFTRGLERVLAAVGLRRLFGAPVTVRARRRETGAK